MTRISSRVDFTFRNIKEDNSLYISKSNINSNKLASQVCLRRRLQLVEMSCSFMKNQQ